MRLQAHAFRALNPVWIADPLSGEGAKRYSGRFNPKGTPALYTALDPITAVREVSQIGQPLQPTMLVTYAIDVDPIFDGTDVLALAAYNMAQADLARNDWRVQAEPVTHAFALALIRDGYAGLRAPSFARGAGPASLNLILWKWGPDLPTQVRLIDTEGRLTPAPPTHDASGLPSA